ncbi:flap endonuclease GEN-like 1 isoform X1 [Selaginella moellendorffii]|uniref:flap endonuclease GEN-like 1 isoform X1 n=1 Tax=Selaginella moellendorffii TaxID=88036 RepID=UPI000D1C769E|nr:flap endonuclease GEN-like 1 isoform X1 [Selaginella moellendorffii]|eukprot:XP_024529031.1 flap endonuclease GEN-like 1 isoform X1 [Selaginella moellendorffii]
MGVGGGFWELVKPLRHSSDDLSTLQDKRLAIDLSHWIVQQEAVLKDRARKPHLRLLFFRVVTLVAKVGALPVFVVDGDAPLLKLPARIERFSRLSGIPAAQLNGGDNHRNRAFLENVEECVELLGLLNVPVLRATSEAEALCAELERNGVVDACVTPDSDAFLHGASCVIQTLQADIKKPLVESYLASDIRLALQLEREHLIALALLVGCDYNLRGIPGVGYSNAMRLVQHFSKDEILDNLRKWGRREYPSPEVIGKLSDSANGFDSKEGDDAALQLGRRKDSHCSMCGHPGNKKLHTKLGCEDCGSLNTAGCSQKTKNFKCGCGSCAQDRRRKKHEKDVTWWSNLRAKISAIEDFPNEEIIEIFLNTGATSYLREGQSLDLRWEAPKMEPLELFLGSHLHWDVSYIRKKTLPLLSHYSLKAIAEGSSMALLNGRYIPTSILKLKTNVGKPLYVVKWNAVDSFGGPGGETNEDSITTDEQISLIKRACPALVSKFEDQQKFKRPTRREKKEPDPDQRNIMSFFKVKSKQVSCEGSGVELLAPTAFRKESNSLSSKQIIDLDSSDEDDVRVSVKRRLF